MSSEWSPGALASYLDGLVPPRSDEMARMEAYAQDHDFPIVGPASGQLCYLVARMTGARRVFELGSGYGYSTAWFARAVKENGGGEVTHVVWHDDLSDRAQQHLGALGFGGIVRYIKGEAVQALREADGAFDLIFMDIDKTGYPDAVPVIEERLRPGGALIVDNMLWHGRVFDEADHAPETEAIRRLTHLLTQDHKWITAVVPIRDGVSVSYRR